MSTDNTVIDTCREALRSFTAGKNKTLWIVLLGLVGILLIGLSSCASGNEATAAQADEFEVAAYTAQLEKRLADMVMSIKGAGEAQVFVTLENGVEYIYANEEKTNSDHTERDDGQVSVSDDSQRTVVTVDDQNGKTGLLVTQIEPTVRGVVVTCEGAADETVATLVRQAVKTALNITDKRVCVIPYVG